MKSFLQLAQQRYSCRNYQEKPVERHLIEQCLQAAVCAPSARNEQPWIYHVITDYKLKMQITEPMQPFTVNAGCLIVIEQGARNPQTSRDYRDIDIGLNVAHIVLAAQHLGLGSCILGYFDAETIKTALKLQSDAVISLVVCLGYPSESGLTTKSRKSLEQIATWYESN